MKTHPTAALLAVAGAVAALQACSDDWTNAGGNAQRNGLSSEIGPSAPDLLWQRSWGLRFTRDPVSLGSRLFLMHSLTDPFFGGNGSTDPIHAYDIETGQLLWTAIVPYSGNPNDDWHAFIGGAHGGRVYASRGQNQLLGNPIYAYDAVTGAPLWTSEFARAGDSVYESWVFDDASGDLIVDSFSALTRISEVDGSTVWSTDRLCAVSGHCGATLGDGCIYVVEPSNAVSFSTQIVKYDLETGNELYRSISMPGVTVQNLPFVSRDKSTVYLCRTQSNVTTDFLYSFEDTGSQLAEKWARPVRWTTYGQGAAIGPDDSIYTLLYDDSGVGTVLARLDPEDGSVVSSTGTLLPFDFSYSFPRLAVDATGRVYLSNGWPNDPGEDGRVWAFTPDLATELFQLSLFKPNTGGPALVQNGTLIVSDRNGLYAYRSDPACLPDLTGEGDVNINDFFLFLSLYQAMDPRADFAPGGGINTNDFFAFLAAYQAGC